MPRVRTSIAVLILVQVLSSLCFPLIARGSTMAPPLFFAAQRAVVGAVVLLGIAALLRKPMPRGRFEWMSVGVVGLTGDDAGILRHVPGH